MFSINCFFFEVLLEVGREGRCFTYKDSLKLGVDDSSDSITHVVSLFILNLKVALFL